MRPWTRRRSTIANISYEAAGLDAVPAAKNVELLKKPRTPTKSAAGDLMVCWSMRKEDKISVLVSVGLQDGSLS